MYGKDFVLVEKEKLEKMYETISKLEESCRVLQENFDKLVNAIR